MSQTQQSTAFQPLPIGRRINEILEEKGGAFSQRSFAPRVGLSKDTLRRIIDGERHCKPSEVQRIAEGLSISVARLKQDDTAGLHIELLGLLDNKQNLKRALLLAEVIQSHAIGYTERCDAALLKARTEYAMGHYDRAHEYLLESYHHAETIYEKYNETDRLYTSLSKLLITFTVRKEYSRMSVILARVESVFSSDPEKMANICFSKAMIAEQFGNVEEVRVNLYKSLELHQVTGKQNDIGRAEQNVGYFEFKQKNYEVAKRFLRDSIPKLQGDTYNQLIAIKEYVKTLLKLDETDAAVRWLENALQDVEQFPELKGKFYLLFAIAKQDVPYADSIFHIPNVGKSVLRLTCKYLTKHYMKLGDSESVLKYSMIAERYALNHSDIIDEEDL